LPTEAAALASVAWAVIMVALTAAAFTAVQLYAVEWQ
jgi:hypothetical protein